MILDLTKRQPKPGITVLELKGSIHRGPDCRRVELEVDALIREQQLHIIFDLSGLTHIDSAAVGSIVRCFSTLKKANGDLRLAGATGMLEGTLKMTRVDRVIPLYPTADAASTNFPPPASPHCIT